MTEIPVAPKATADKATLAGDVPTLTGFLRAYHNHPQLNVWYAETGYKPANGDEANARRIVPYAYYFDTWAELLPFFCVTSPKDSSLYCSNEIPTEIINSCSTIFLYENNS